ncbi:hypothetical protein [Streptomyces echinatus]|uniref:hypothetical protein n=1 Tax=Streptomyces echinatus TaxID=67293 RepID=UPI003CD09716
MVSFQNGLHNPAVLRRRAARPAPVLAGMVPYNVVRFRARHRAPGHCRAGS